MTGVASFSAWLALLLPLAGAAIIALFTSWNPSRSGGISIAAAVLSFLFSLMAFAALPSGGMESAMTWLSVGGFHVEIGLRLDALSLGMMLVVSGVGSLIHVYSWGYMSGDRGLARYFASLNFFTFAMLGIVLSNNFLQMFVFWELVGVSSYLLIGFWYERGSAADASKKAFLTNRVGDFGFLLGIIIIWAGLGTLNFAELQAFIGVPPEALGGMATVAGLLIFCGAIAKSAQFPLHVWLPDAMEGPTPVSALIHAATMVAAGVYMLCRVFFLFPAPALEVISWVGGFTALLAAVIAVQQDDIKRILAYSTLSQLGYMVMAVGLRGPDAAMFHLTTHAFFKALLFLGAGSVIYALRHEQNIWRMGALRGKMPLTFWTFLVGTLALAGAPPLSGFYSKDAILIAAYHQNPILLAVGVLVAVLTAFYMFRLLFAVFYGSPRSEAARQAQESPGVMTGPLVVLAVPAALAGFWGIHPFFAAHFGVDPGLPQGVMAHLLDPFGHAPVSAFASLGAVLFGFMAARELYWKVERDSLPGRLGMLGHVIKRKFYFDEIYDWFISLTQESLARLADWTDRWIISGLGVRGVHGGTELFGRALRLAQTGNLQTYAFLLVAGVALLLFYILRS
jgi:NADH-quinone oxidoreductase subunit L